MSESNYNLHILKSSRVNSLSPLSDAPTSVTVIDGYIHYMLAQEIVKRAHNLHDIMSDTHDTISEIYGEEATVKLMNNFSEIIEYSKRFTLESCDGYYDNYFLKLNSFCGQIEHILKMIRYYKSLF